MEHHKQHSYPWEFPFVSFYYYYIVQYYNYYSSAIQSAKIVLWIVILNNLNKDANMKYSQNQIKSEVSQLTVDSLFIHMQ